MPVFGGWRQARQSLNLFFKQFRQCRESSKTKAGVPVNLTPKNDAPKNNSNANSFLPARYVLSSSMDGGVSTLKDNAFSQIPSDANWPIDGGFSNNIIIARMVAKKRIVET
jgi:hypothetical protein